MDSDEVKRLMRKIADQGHETLYDPRTKAELDALGVPGMAESVLGPQKVLDPPDDADDVVVACTVILPGQMLTLPDNKTGPCSWGCGRTVQYRPWVKHPVVCLYCVSERPKDNQ